MFASVGRLILESRHMLYHLSIGGSIGYLVFRVSAGLSFGSVLAFALLGSVLPDVDHLIFFLLYGRTTVYSKKLRQAWREKGFWGLVRFYNENHKDNCGLYSHNLLIAFVATFLGIEVGSSNPCLAAFLLSLGGHLWFDVLDDLVILGRLNPNWFLKFSKE